ncbi:MAG TPA: enoyl-CoA hydratase [Acidimicrobiales bacterium]|nr:enoyl-CoA hydratase [Acidimicrobiales bacterium]
MSDGVDHATGTDQLLVEVEDGVGRVTFNNPTKHNALSLAMRAAMPDAIAALEQDPAVRVVVMTGAGTKAFMSGADISEFGAQRTTPEARAEYDRSSATVASAWNALGKPIIAMIRGYCMGGGLLTALQADIRLASPDARFAVPAARLGLGYGIGGVQALREIVGPAAAAEILFSARRLDAHEALSIGLVNRVVEAEQLEHAVMELAHAIAANAPLTVAACKVALRELRRPPEQRDLARVAELVEACFRSEDYLEGQAAFAEKREPRFRGR